MLLWVCISSRWLACCLIWDCLSNLIFFFYFDEISGPHALLLVIIGAQELEFHMLDIGPDQLMVICMLPDVGRLMFTFDEIIGSQSLLLLLARAQELKFYMLHVDLT